MTRAVTLLVNEWNITTRLSHENIFDIFFNSTGTMTLSLASFALPLLSRYFFKCSRKHLTREWGRVAKVRYALEHHVVVFALLAFHVVKLRHITFQGTKLFCHAIGKAKDFFLLISYYFSFLYHYFIVMKQVHNAKWLSNCRQKIKMSLHYAEYTQECLMRSHLRNSQSVYSPTTPWPEWFANDIELDETFH